VQLNPDVIVTLGPALLPVFEATRAIPVVFVSVSDPVGQGFVSSLAHPGGNVTGFALFEFSVGGKFVELLKEIAPTTKRVLVLLHPNNPAAQQWWRAIDAAARDLNFEAEQASVRSDDEIDAAIEAHAHRPNGGIIVSPDGFFITHRVHLAAAAARARLPAVYWSDTFVRDGGLVSFGVDTVDEFIRAAGYADRILKGEKPRDLPVQLPTKFTTAINLKTAKALGVNLPPTFLVRADEVIE
jgi:putative ABC transport system substrate-binding protein